MSREDWFWMAAAAIFVAVVLFLCGMTVGIHETWRRAIEAGVAEWTVDQKTGTTTFRFKESAQP